MLSPALYSEIDRRWDILWPTNTLKPLAIIDLVSFLLFIKRLDELQLANEQNATSVGQPLEHPLFTKEQLQLRWHVFKNMETQSLHQLFIQPGGVLDFMKTYGEKDNLFSRFIAPSLLIMPTRRLLESSVGIVKIMEDLNAADASIVFEHLLAKLTTTPGRAALASLTATLMNDLLQPAASEIIYDGTTYLGTFLKTQLSATQQNSSAVNNEQLTGAEASPVLLRIAAMRLMLNGIEEPNVTISDTEDNTSLDGATVVTCNLLLAAPEDDANATIVAKKKIELQAAQRMLQKIQNGGRGMIVVPELVLSDANSGWKEFRRQMVEAFQLQAVVSLTGDVIKPFSSMSALLFSKKETVTDVVLFTAINVDAIASNPGQITSDYLAYQASIDALLQKINNNTIEGGALWISASSIKETQFNLSSKTYDAIAKKEEKDAELITEKVKTQPEENATHHSPSSQNGHFQKPRPKEKKSKKLMAYVALFFISMLGLAAFLFFTGKIKNRVPPEVTQTKATDTTQNKPLVKSLMTEDNSINDVKATDEKKVPVKVGLDASLKRATSSVKQPALLPNTSFTKSVSSATPDVNEENFQNTKGQYKIISKAYFHNQPDENTRRNAFVNHWNNSYATINALDEENGFVYVVFKNNLGQTSKGWLRKKDLRPVSQ